VPKVSFASLSGPLIVPFKTHSDNRGRFSKIYDGEKSEFDSKLPLSVSISQNELAGTLRGLHFQVTPHSEIKIITCLTGAIYDVLVDIRPDSPNFGNWASFELSSESPTQLYIPHGFAHGFQTLLDDSTISYLIWGRFSPQASRRLAYNDKQLDIFWPLPISQISEEDANASLYEAIACEL
jgi:dTDP-4-dehydrorhamnose 3,5-epimerase